MNPLTRFVVVLLMALAAVIHPLSLDAQQPAPGVPKNLRPKLSTSRVPASATTATGTGTWRPARSQ
jgi:hypothetical protein